MATWQPRWQAQTAYAVTAVVIPTTFGGYTWRCTTAGTSGASEPAWPADPSVSPTVTDGTVTWTVGTAFAQAIQSGLGTLIQAFINANPTILRAFRGVRPRSFSTVDLPVFYIGDINESIDTGNGVRTRTVDGFSCFVVDNLGEQIESNDRMTFVRDALTDLFTSNPHAISGRSIFQHTATIDTERDDIPVPYAALEFVFAATKVAEGRS